MGDPFAIDDHKLMYHPERVAAWRAAGDDWERVRRIYPIYVEVAPVGACNHRCTFCSVDYIGYVKRRLPEDVLGERLAEMARLGVRSVMFAGEGEPLLHPKIGTLAARAGAAGLDVAFTTNGVALTRRFLDEALAATTWIKVSLNAGTRDTYARVHRTDARDFDRVLDNLRRAVRLREESGAACTLGAQCLLLPENAEEIANLARLCRDDLGIDYLVVKPYTHNPNGLTNRYRDLDYRRYADLGSRLRPLSTDRFHVIFREKTLRHYLEEPSARYPVCGATPFFAASVMADGSVYSCQAHLLNPRFRLGNLLEDSFQAIWEGEARRANWLYVQKELDLRTCRRNCRMDKVNRYLDRLRRDPVPHVNFI